VFHEVIFFKIKVARFLLRHGVYNIDMSGLVGNVIAHISKIN